METKLCSLIGVSKTEYEKYISEAAEIIKSGGLVAFPTETVYGLGASALSGDGAKKIYAAKGRPSDNPLIVHISKVEDIEKYCMPDEKSLALCKKFMPGPITVIMKKKPCIPDEVTAGLDTVAIRCPQDENARAFIEKCGVAIAAPSANTSGRPSPTSAMHVCEDLNGKIEMILDGGECKIGLESTIVRINDGATELLRPGGVTPEELIAVCGKEHFMINPAILQKLSDDQKPVCAGMKYRHYSPRAKVVLVDGETDFDKNRFILQKLKENKNAEKIGVLCFDEDIENELFCGEYVFSLGKRDAFSEQSHLLFARLRDCDKTDVSLIYAKTPPKSGLGLALFNRLIKAAGFDIVFAEHFLRIALTGGIGSGKGVAGKIFSEYGVPTLDTDKLYHSLIGKNSPLAKEISRALGENLLMPDGSLDRKKTAKTVFADKEKLLILNTVSHKAVRKETLLWMYSQEKNCALVEVPLLWESGMQSDFDKIVCVCADKEARLSRIVARDNCDKETALLRIAAQKDDEFFRANSDFVIENGTSDRNELKKAVSCVYYALFNEEKQG